MRQWTKLRNGKNENENAPLLSETPGQQDFSLPWDEMAVETESAAVRVTAKDPPSTSDVLPSDAFERCEYKAEGKLVFKLSARGREVEEVPLNELSVAQMLGSFPVLAVVSLAASQIPLGFTETYLRFPGDVRRYDGISFNPSRRSSPVKAKKEPEGGTGASEPKPEEGTSSQFEPPPTEGRALVGKNDGERAKIQTSSFDVEERLNDLLNEQFADDSLRTLKLKAMITGDRKELTLPPKGASLDVHLNPKLVQALNQLLRYVRPDYKTPEEKMELVAEAKDGDVRAQFCQAVAIRFKLDNFARINRDYSRRLTRTFNEIASRLINHEWF